MDISLSAATLASLIFFSLSFYAVLMIALASSSAFNNSSTAQFSLPYSAIILISYFIYLLFIDILYNTIILNICNQPQIMIQLLNLQHVLNIYLYI